MLLSVFHPGSHNIYEGEWIKLFKRWLVLMIFMLKTNKQSVFLCFATKSTKEWLVQLVTEPNKFECVRKKGLNIHNKFCPHKMALMSLRCKLILLCKFNYLDAYSRPNHGAWLVHSEVQWGWIGVGWDGMVIIDQQSSRSTFGANKRHKLEHCQ